MVMSIVCLNPDVLYLVDRDLRKLGQDFSKNGGMRQPIIRSIKEVIMPSIAENFMAGGRPKAWKELEPATIATRMGGRVPGQKATQKQIARYEAKAASFAPLMRTRKLYNAATAYARWHVAGNEARFGNLPPRVWYGIVHQTPEIAARAMNNAQAAFAGTGIPVRQFLLFQKEDWDNIRDIFVEWINERVERRLRRHYV